ncbi:hypothetical protein PsYK624_136360 [Phanerochaete sordida]|uniref:Uncharacterized protein n=1 Tax=Phanerochaete sordida TaxID=48140 RepID=A0A9P3GM08_9APHY|nr:hypothetical protein PsYK624_136360 [Phanerochaete sordida]
MDCAEFDEFPSSSRTQIEISESRDEHWVRPPPRRHVASVDPLEPRPLLHVLAPEYKKYMRPRRVEVVPGLQDDGKITVRHPFVDRFIARMPTISPAEGRRPPIEAWWKKGIKEKTVSEVLNVGASLDEYQSDCVFALAALKVLHHPKHPKHFAFWGRDPAQKTAERVQKVFDFSPCPIESPVGWLGIQENLWLVDGLQASQFPTKKEGKKVDNGMLLRKRKAHASAAAAAQVHVGAAGELEERPRKRTRTTKVAEKQVAEEAELATPPVPQSDIAEAPTVLVEHHHADKATKLELIGVELPPSSTLEVEVVAKHSADRQAEEPSPEPTRRSARQASKKNPATSAASTPMTELGSLPETLSPMSSAPASVDEQRPTLTRARSSSSSSGSSTAVSDTGSGGDTAVEPDSNEGSSKGKGKAKLEDEADADVEKAPVRTSGRVRKPAKKALHVEEEPVLPLKKAAPIPTENRKSKTKRS